jgi:hypothetical protein
MSRSESIPFVEIKDDWNGTGYYWCLVEDDNGYIYGPVVKWQAGGCVEVQDGRYISLRLYSRKSSGLENNKR